MKYFGLLALTLGGQVLAAETSLICEYGDRVETQMLRFDEAAGTLRYRGSVRVDSNKHNEHTADGWTLPVSVVFGPTEIKMQFYFCLTAEGLLAGNGGGGYCNKNLRNYTLDRTTGTLTAEYFKKLLGKYDAETMQCRLASAVPQF